MQLVAETKSTISVGAVSFQRGLSIINTHMKQFLKLRLPSYPVKGVNSKEQRADALSLAQYTKSCPFGATAVCRPVAMGRNCYQAFDLDMPHCIGYYT